MTTLLPQERQEAATEVHKIPLPPVEVCIWDLDIAGTGEGSQYIIKDDEAFSMSLKIKFQGGRLVDLLMCYGIQADVEFALEGFGTAAEVNLSAPPVMTSKGVFEYTATLDIPAGPASVNLTPGVYKMAAALTVKPKEPCSDIGPVAFGYISDVVFQVYSH
ncbi:MAG: hypothetical protein ACTS2F_10130 [Thainema sp.]